MKICLITLSSVAVALLAQRSEAHTISVGNGAITADGPNWVWNYTASHTNGRLIANEGMFTIYDFDGYIFGSEASPSGWSFSSALLGTTPSPVQGLFDDPAIPNLTWTYTGAEITNQQGETDVFTGFSASSSAQFQVLDRYVSQDRGLPGNGGALSDSTGPILVPTTQLPPSAVPDAASTLPLLSLGVGMLAFAFRSRK